MEFGPTYLLGLVQVDPVIIFAWINSVQFCYAFNVIIILV